MKKTSKKHELLRQMGDSSPFYLLFDHLAGVAFFAKNRHFELVCANHAFLERLGLQTEQEVIGSTDFQLFPRSLAEHYRSDDRKVLQSGQPILNIVELFINPDGLPDWYLTNKMPIHSQKGDVIGIMGTTQAYQCSHQFIQPYLRIEPAIRFIQENFRTKISIPDVAAQLRLSPRQLDRHFQQVLKMSPREFLMRLRIKTACEALRQGNQPILDIALSLGFYDQSSFSLHFRRHIGISPLQYRKRERIAPNERIGWQLGNAGRNHPAHP